MNKQAMSRAFANARFLTNPWKSYVLISHQIKLSITSEPNPRITRLRN